jgi:diguanylate cyclase (GGDEF)-like protein
MDFVENLKTEKLDGNRIVRPDMDCRNLHGLLQGQESISGWLSKDIEVLDYFSGDIERVPRTMWDPLEKLRANRGEELYADLLMALTHKSLAPVEAQALWHELMAHKYFLSEKLGRNVGVRVAVLDFFDNHKGQTRDLRLLPEKDLDCLLLFVNEDGLTGLFNHRYFQEQIRHELARSRRYNRVLSLLVLDLDKFKSYNDHLGHRQGDHLLQTISDLFVENKRDSDIVARYGGDEFTIILPETNQAEALGYAKRLRQAVEERKFGAKREDGVLDLVTVSIGVATFPHDGNTAEEIIEAGDQALYRAKRAGRNLVRGSRRNEARGEQTDAVA